MSHKLARYLLLLMLAVACRQCLGQIAHSDYKPLVLLSGNHFPNDRSQLLRLRSKVDGDAIRKVRTHAWDLFAGLIPGGIPIWDTWYTKAELSNPSPSAANDTRLRFLKNLELPVQDLSVLENMVPEPVSPQSGAANALVGPALSYQSALASLLDELRTSKESAGVLFNQDAADHILKNCLLVPPLQKRPDHCPTIPPAPGKIRGFPRASVALKTVWGVVGPASSDFPYNNVIQRAFRATLWNEVHSEGTALDGFEKEIHVDFSGAKCAGDYEESDLVALDCFYHTLPLTAEDIGALNDQLVFIAGSGKPGSNGLVAGKSLILLGVHVTTKETGDWVWATFWWDNHPSSDWHSHDRPARLNQLSSPPWNHYLMDTTLSATAPIEQDGGPKICFNPFLETSGMINDGIISNCLQCHRRAAFGPFRGIAYELGVPGRDGKTPANHTKPRPDYFRKMVSTDFLWSVADARDAKLQEILSDLQSLALKLNAVQQKAP